MVQCKSSSHGTALYGKGMQHHTLRCLSCSLLFHRYFAAWREMLNANHWIDTNVKCVLSPSLAAKLLPKLEGKPVHGLPSKIRFWQQCFVHGLCISIRHNTFTGSQWLATCVFFSGGCCGSHKEMKSSTSRSWLFTQVHQLQLASKLQFWLHPVDLLLRAAQVWLTSKQWRRLLKASKAFRKFEVLHIEAII